MRRSSFKSALPLVLYHPHLIVDPMATPTRLAATSTTYTETLMDFASSSSSSSFFLFDPR